MPSNIFPVFPPADPSHAVLRDLATGPTVAARQHALTRPLDLDIGVIYTHESDYMDRLLSTLAQSAPGVRARLLLVDNVSADGVERWTGYLPSTVVLHNTHRLGYAANLNRILQASSARYVLLLNTDMYFDPAARCISRMVSFMDAHPDCGVSGCALFHADGNYAYPARRFQTLPIVLARRMFGLKRLMQGTLDNYFYRDRDNRGIWPCQWLSGCFHLIRREAIAEVGPFDERFGKYFEDVDMCLRMARHGWDVMYNGSTHCYHLERRASANVFSLDAWKHLRAYLRWHGKWGFAYNHEPAAAPRRRAAA